MHKGGIRLESWPDRDQRLACVFVFFFQAEDGIRDLTVTGVQTCALPIWKALIKLVNPALQGAPNMTQEYMAELVSETIEMVVQVNRSVDGKRQVTAIAEVVGRQAGMVVTQDLWLRDRPGAPLIWTGVRPERLLEKFAAAGLAHQ